MDRATGQYVLTFLKIGDGVELDRRGSIRTTPDQGVSSESAEPAAEISQQVASDPPAASSTDSKSASAETNGQGQYARCTANDVNVRATPEKNARSVGQIKRNEIVYVFDFGEGEKETAWAHISEKVGERYVLSR